MAIKEVPINTRTYHRLFIESYTKKINDAEEEKDKLEVELRESHKKLVTNIESYKTNFDIDLNDYEEFINNKYVTGLFYKDAKGLFINRKNNYTLVADLYDLYHHAENQKRVAELTKDLSFYNRLIKIKYTEYNEILRAFYTEVHKKLILNGDGYAFSGRLGWICINRVVMHNNKPVLDFVATKKREAELKAAGVRIYNKEEAEWCLKNGIEYKAEDKRVFRKNEYYYEVPLLGCTLPNSGNLKLEISDYRHRSVRGKSMQELIEDCNNDTDKICELNVDLKVKLSMCDKADKILYTKFIRNEDQKSLANTKVNSQN